VDIEEKIILKETQLTTPSRPTKDDDEYKSLNKGKDSEKEHV